MLACAGDVPTLEMLAAATLLRKHLPDLKVRVVNVVDLMRLQPRASIPTGCRDREFDALFTADRPVIFAYHGYPWLIHRLTYRRTNHANIHVRGYKEEGTTTTPFDMVMLNDLDRYHLVIDVIDRVPGTRRRAPPTSASRWSTPARRPACTPASTARTRRRSPAGRGRWSRRRAREALVVNAGSSSLKLRVVENDDTVSSSSTSTPTTGVSTTLASMHALDALGASTPPGTGWCTEGPVPDAGRSRRGRAGHARRPRRPGTAPPADGTGDDPHAE